MPPSQTNKSHYCGVWNKWLIANLLTEPTMLKFPITTDDREHKQWQDFSLINLFCQFSRKHPHYIHFHCPGIIRQCENVKRENPANRRAQRPPACRWSEMPRPVSSSAHARHPFGGTVSVHAHEFSSNVFWLMSWSQCRMDLSGWHQYSRRKAEDFSNHILLSNPC